MAEKKPILTRPKHKPAKKGEKPVAIVRNGKVATPQGPKGRVEAISPDPKSLNLPGRKTPKGQTIGRGDYDNRSEETIDRTLKPAVRKVMKGVVRKGHNVKFPDDPEVHDPSPFYPEEEDK